jgi:hypothetical protein
MTTTPTPRIIVKAALPAEAFIIIERPGHEPAIIAGSDASAADALDHLRSLSVVEAASSPA